ncbi:hypothetical protein FV218_11935 [Methylobacterium sp. WL69]|uniref:hypothetical protein n=1 Tax=Methylobacterium sp. WL69 TaxID=2603893 RepID=UPI0011C7F285|nr:hypothetical protein [Methylobacterium sp. WL69]TXM73132.1 hypothetical protein FV218_11935 [Methylobacterium sp. WL69]
MTERNSPAVEAIIQEALTTVRPTQLLAEAVRRTTKGGRWKGRLKMTRDEALAATRVVTDLVHRHGLRATTVLQRDGRASGRGQTYRFFLTEEEMATGAISPERSLAKGISAHVDNVRAVAAAARSAGCEVDEDAMMAELADAVAGFLDQFRDMSDEDPNAELARDVCSIATWLAKPSRRFELVRCLSGANRLDLDYDRVTGEMSHVGQDVSSYAYGVMPWVALRTRAVARGDCIVFRRDEAELAEETRDREGGGFSFYASPKIHEIGREGALVCEKVGLGVCVDGARGLRMMFTVDHVTCASTSFLMNAASGPPRMPGHLACPGIPEIGSPKLASDEVHYVQVASPLEYLCPDFEAYVAEAFGEESQYGIGEAMYVRRFLPVTPETCRFLLDGGGRDAIFAWRHFAAVAEESVLPSSAINDEGAESWLIRERFSELLYDRGERGLVGLLEAESMNRAQAYDDFLMRSETGARRRKLEFRSRMRG